MSLRLRLCFLFSRSLLGPTWLLELPYTSSNKDKGTKSGSLPGVFWTSPPQTPPFKAIFSKSHRTVLLTSYWPPLSHMITPHCKGIWEICLAKSKGLFLKSKGVWMLREATSCLPQTTTSDLSLIVKGAWRTFKIFSITQHNPVANQEVTCTCLCEYL